MNVLVTGGTGYLGRAIVHALARRGHQPVVFARTASQARLPGRAVDGDVRDVGALRSAARSCDAICHTAALVSVWRPRPEEFDEVNVGGLQNALAIARELGIPRLAYTSSFLALPPRDQGNELAANDYQRTKVQASRLARRAADEGAPLTCLYPGALYGSGARTEGNLVGRLIADHLQGRLPGVVGADRLWSLAHVDEVAESHVSALERGRPGARYVLGGENAPQMRIFEILRDLVGRPLPWRIPFPVATLIAAVEEARAGLTGARPLLTRGAVEIFRHDWALDSALAIRELGHRIVPLADGLRRTVEEMGL